MSKRALLLAAAILTVSGAVAVTKSFMPVTSATAMDHGRLAPARAASPLSPSGMIAIIPAPVIDVNAEVFVGTGDGSGGAWIKP